MTEGVLGASFRDPSGFVFEREGRIYRQVNRIYAESYDLLGSSGLYEQLVEASLLLPHEEVDEPVALGPSHYRTLAPEQLEFVSHPWEWCFGQLKDAALLTLRIQREALGRGMSLKDASAYNVQFQRGRPVFIDTLSFERYREGDPWVGYRQFCQHFLAPLALMSLRDVRLLQLLRVHLDGVPLDLATALLPRRAWLRLGLLLHIRLHSRFQRRYEGAEGDAAKRTARPLSRSAQLNLIGALEGSVRGLDWAPEGTEWADYTEGDSYAAAALEHKKTLVGDFVAATGARLLWDLGANTGDFSRVAAARGARVVAFDVDPACVERNYREVRRAGERDVLPLLLDLVNPSPAIGWAHRERQSLRQRATPDALLVLALIHHIAISNNVPLERIASFFAELAEQLVIEFVPKGDAKVERLLATREDIFPDYTREGFESAFGRLWSIQQSAAIEGSERRLYRLRRKAAPGR